MNDPKPKVLKLTTGLIHESRFYYKLQRGKQYGPSVLDQICAAQTADEIHANLLSAMTHTAASPATKRKWKKAAEKRLAQLRVAALVR